MFKQLILSIFILLFINACQTHLSVIDENRDCGSEIENIELTDIDYLLYANKMVDSMIQNRRIQELLSAKRMNLMLLPVSNNTSEAIELLPINTAIYNRLLRSGHFIFHQTLESSQYQLTGEFNEIKKDTDSCDKAYKRFSMQLKSLPDAQVLWSEEKKFN